MSIVMLLRLKMMDNLDKINVLDVMMFVSQTKQAPWIMGSKTYAGC